MESRLLDLLRETDVERAIRADRLAAPAPLLRDGWWHVPDDEWAALRDLATRIDALSALADNTRRWNADHNFVGKAGERFYSLLADERFVWEASVRDGGTDFPGVDVKATPHYSGPRLLRLATDPLKAPAYWLAAFDVDRRRLRPVGWATREMLLGAPLHDYGYGPTRTLREHDLLAGLP